MKKKILFTLIAIIYCISGFSQSKKEIFEKFKNSKTYLTHLKEISKYGKLDFKQSEITKIDVSNAKLKIDTVYSIMVMIVNKKKITAQLQIVLANGTKHLPNKDQYALNLIDLRKFNYKEKSGTVTMYDLNYDNHLHTIAKVKESKILSWKHFDIPKEVSNKYRIYRNPKIIGIGPKGPIQGYLLCDNNRNGDVSFSECYKCFQNGIDMNGLASFICDIPVAGWIGCWGSTSAACVAISCYY